MGCEEGEKVKNKFMQIILLSLSLVFVIPSVSFASYGFRQGDYVELNGYLFRVLEPDVNYLLYDGYLENRAFDLNGTNVYDPTDTNNLAYYLNTTFLNNLGDISNYVKTYDWTIGYETNESAKFVSAKIGSLSYSEWKKYSLYFGAGFLETPSYIFWTRTPTSKYPTTGTWAVNYFGNLTTGTSSIPQSSRPSLYLEDGLTLSGSGTKENPYSSNGVNETLSDISDLSLLNTTYNSILLTWKNPTETNFSHLNMYQDDLLVKTDFTGGTYEFTGLTPSKEYKFTIKAVDNHGLETDGISIIVSTDDMPLVPEVTNLVATTEKDRVNLSWNNPNSEFFHHVRIYRRTDEVYSSPTANNQNSLEDIIIGNSVSAAETTDFTPMFETNGTYWNDLTVEPATTYEYKLTTQNIAGAESEGQIIQATTLAEPPPEMDGEKVETDQNGDYKVTWTSPTTGKVKILIDGSEYAVVDASLMEYTIPAADMEYDLFGNPKVQLVPISETGKEGEPVKPPVDGKTPGSIGVTLPFTATDFLKIVMSLIAWVGPFILLVLAIYFAPRIIQFLKGVILKYKEGKLKL